MTSSDNNSKKNKDIEDSLVDTFIEEVNKRKVIKEQSKLISDEINNKKSKYIESIDEHYNSRSKMIDNNSDEITNAIDSGNVEELQKAFQKMLDEMNK